MRGHGRVASSSKLMPKPSTMGTPSAWMKSRYVSMRYRGAESVMVSSAGHFARCAACRSVENRPVVTRLPLRGSVGSLETHHKECHLLSALRYQPCGHVSGEQA